MHTPYHVTIATRARNAHTMCPSNLIRFAATDVETLALLAVQLESMGQAFEANRVGPYWEITLLASQETKTPRRES